MDAGFAGIVDFTGLPASQGAVVPSGNVVAAGRRAMIRHLISQAQRQRAERSVLTENREAVLKRAMEQRARQEAFDAAFRMEQMKAAYSIVLAEL